MKLEISIYERGLIRDSIKDRLEKADELPVKEVEKLKEMLVSLD